MMIEPLVKDLLEAGVHFGHQTHRWNPKMKRFIFGEKNGIYILDLQKTAQGVEEAKAFLRSIAAEGGPILFVGTKRQAQPIIAAEATRCGQFYVNLRWLGGLLTNFQTIRKSIERLKTIRNWHEDGTFERMTKKERARADSELARLEKVLGGIIEMPKLPKAVFVVDAKREETAIREAVRLEIPVVALVDTNSNPDPITHVIPGNDDAIRSIGLVTSLLADSIREGYQLYLAGQEEARKKAEAEAAAQAAQQAAAEKAAAEKAAADKVAAEQQAAADKAAADKIASEAETPQSDAAVTEEVVPPPEPEEEIVPEALLKTAIKGEEEELKKRAAAKAKEQKKEDDKKKPKGDKKKEEPPSA